MPRSSAAHASVAYIRLQDFAAQPVGEQANLKAKLEDAVARALTSLDEHERIVLDAPGGLAVVVLANAQGALRLAQVIAESAEVPVAVGLAHGPVRAIEGPPASLHGDALLAAETVARSSPAGGVSASREFREALAAASPRDARRMPRAGSAVDAQDRALETYRADRAAAARSDKRFHAAAGAIAAVILAIGLVARLAGDPPASVPAAAGIDKPAVIVAAKPATLTFDIRPEGEIYVNGALKGKSPPLRKIQLPAGKHQIEIRSGKHKPMATEMVVAEGEELSVQHSFISAQPAKPFYRRWLDKAEKALK